MGAEWEGKRCKVLDFDGQKDKVLLGSVLKYFHAERLYQVKLDTGAVLKYEADRVKLHEV